MIRAIKNSVYTKVLWGLMGLHLLNISVDVADPHPEHIPEDLSFNDQESIVEIFIEKILGFEKAIEEYDDHDAEDHNKKNVVQIDLLVLVSEEYNYSRLLLEQGNQRFPDYKARLTEGFEKTAILPPIS